MFNSKGYVQNKPKAGDVVETMVVYASPEPQQSPSSGYNLQISTGKIRISAHPEI